MSVTDQPTSGDFERAAAVAPAPLVDPFARAITYLRVSVTDRCDFRCVYCMSENMTFPPKADVLSLEELDRLCSAFIAKGVRKLRLTGGEPLVRRGMRRIWLQSLRDGRDAGKSLRHHAGTVPRKATGNFESTLLRCAISWHGL